MRRAEGNEMERKQTLIEEQVKVGDLNGRKGSWTETDRRRETHFLVTVAQTVHGSDDDGRWTSQLLLRCFTSAELHVSTRHEKRSR